VIIILKTFAGSFEMAVVAMMGSRVEKTWDWAAQNPVWYGSDHYIRGHRGAQWSLCRKAMIVTLETFAGSLEMAIVAMMGSRAENVGLLKTSP
jgi:predicted branched-subunit amino acid permease